MREQPTYTISAIAKEVGEKPRAVQFWADLGILRPEGGTFRKGKGVHRRFSATELQYARAAASLVATNAPLSEVAAVVERLRSLDFDDLIEKTEEMKNIINEYKINKSTSDVPRREDVYDQFLKFVEAISFVGSEEEAVWVVIIYYREDNEVKIKVRFWLPTIAVCFNNSIELFSSFAVYNVIGFKVVDFSEGARNLVVSA